MVPLVQEPLTLYCDNNGAVTNSKEARSHKKSKKIKRQYHMNQDITQRGDMKLLKIESKNNHVDPFTMILTQKTFDNYEKKMGVSVIH